ncbi:hypothetical protein CR513_06868, partial [Mucuna pruriens]
MYEVSSGWKSRNHPSGPTGHPTDKEAKRRWITRFMSTFGLRSPPRTRGSKTTTNRGFEGNTNRSRPS